MLIFVLSCSLICITLSQESCCVDENCIRFREDVSEAVADLQVVTLYFSLISDCPETENVSDVFSVEVRQKDTMHIVCFILHRNIKTRQITNCRASGNCTCSTQSYRYSITFQSGSVLEFVAEFENLPKIRQDVILKVHEISLDEVNNITTEYVVLASTLSKQNLQTQETRKDVFTDYNAKTAPNFVPILSGVMSAIVASVISAAISVHCLKKRFRGRRSVYGAEDHLPSPAVGEFGRGGDPQVLAQLVLQQLQQPILDFIHATATLRVGKGGGQGAELPTPESSYYEQILDDRLGIENLPQLKRPDSSDQDRGQHALEWDRRSEMPLTFASADGSSPLLSMPSLQTTDSSMLADVHPTPNDYLHPVPNPLDATPVLQQAVGGHNHQNNRTFEDSDRFMYENV